MSDKKTNLPAPAAQGFNLDAARIEHAARARRDGDLVETLCAGIMQLQEEGARLVEELAGAKARIAELEAELKAKGKR